jgi:hypothetical protein
MAPGTPEQLLEQRCDALIRELDELCALAVDPATSAMVDEQRPTIGHIITRSATLGRLLLAHRPAPFRRTHAA